jgi:hypothetical protein
VDGGSDPTLSLAGLPAPVRGYFEADAVRDIGAVLSVFTPDAVVVDEGRTYRGAEALTDWQSGSASRYEYSVTVLDQDRLPDGRVRIVGRLDGNFPGGTATVNFDFALTGDRISGLHIAP